MVYAHESKVCFFNLCQPIYLLYILSVSSVDVTFYLLRCCLLAYTTAATAH